MAGLREEAWWLYCCCYPVNSGELRTDLNCAIGGLCFPRDQSLFTGLNNWFPLYLSIG